MYGQDTRKVVDRFHKSLIKGFLVSTSIVEYEKTGTVCSLLANVVPVDVRRFVWSTAKIRRMITDNFCVPRTLHYNRWGT